MKLYWLIRNFRKFVIRVQPGNDNVSVLLQAMVLYWMDNHLRDKGLSENWEVGSHESIIAHIDWTNWKPKKAEKGLLRHPAWKCEVTNNNQSDFLELLHML